MPPLLNIADAAHQAIKLCVEREAFLHFGLPFQKSPLVECDFRHSIHVGVPIAVAVL